MEEGLPPPDPGAEASDAAGIRPWGCCGCPEEQPEAAELPPEVFWGDTAGKRLVPERLPAEGNAVMDFHLRAVQWDKPELVQRGSGKEMGAGTVVPCPLTLPQPWQWSPLQAEQAGGHLLVLPAPLCPTGEGWRGQLGAASLPVAVSSGEGATVSDQGSRGMLSVLTALRGPGLGFAASLFS